METTKPYGKYYWKHNASTNHFPLNFLTIEYLNEFNQKIILYFIFTKHMVDPNFDVNERLRFDEIMNKYFLRDKFIKE